MQIIVQSNWPQVERGKRTVRYDVHPLIHWLHRVLPAWLAPAPYIEAKVPNMVDRDPIFVGETIFCSRRQHAALRQEVARRNAAAAFVRTRSPWAYPDA